MGRHAGPIIARAAIAEYRRGWTTRPRPRLFSGGDRRYQAFDVAVGPLSTLMGLNTILDQPTRLTA